jgi:hypothetical protein
MKCQKLPYSICGIPDYGFSELFSTGFTDFGSQVSDQFGVDPPSLEEYLSLQVMALVKY